MFIIVIPKIKKTSKNSTKVQKNLLKNSKPNYCPPFQYHENPKLLGEEGMKKTFAAMTAKKKHRENRKTLPREHFIGCQCVKMFLLKDPLNSLSS